MTIQTTRTFSDIDFNFLPAPSSQDKHIGQGSINYVNNSPIVSGINTVFTNSFSVNDNLYVNNLFVGKVKSIESDTSLTLLNNCVISTSAYPIVWQSANNTVFTSSNIAVTSSTTITQQGLAITVNLATNGIVDGSLIQYQTYGLTDSDLFVTDTKNLAYGNTEGNFTVKNNSASITFTITSGKPLILQFISPSGIELIYVYGVPYRYATPGDLSLKYDGNAIKASIKNLILTMNYERPFNSALGSQSKAILFELATPMTQLMLTRSITDVINAYEPRAQLIDVSVDMFSSPQSVNIVIIFSIINTTEPLTINMVLDRTR